MRGFWIILWLLSLVLVSQLAIWETKRRMEREAEYAIYSAEVFCEVLKNHVKGGKHNGSNP